MSRNFLKSLRLLLFISLVTVSCRKENSQPGNTPPVVTFSNFISNANNKGKVKISPYSLNLNWDNRRMNATYTEAEAAADFGNIGGWNQNLAYTTTGEDGAGCRATLLPNTLTAEGLYGQVNIPDGTEYEMDYDVKFDAAFHWGFGGKVGFGFLIGQGNTGGAPAWNGDGGSLRLMWFSPNVRSKRVYFEPYLYYKDMNGGPSSGNVYGDTFGVSYPATGALVKGQWYHVHMEIKSNTGNAKNGHVQIVIDNTTILDEKIRWTTNDANSLINTLTFNTFRGGDDATWETPTKDYVYYDNLSVQKIK